ncbi:MAG: threonine--tRNA ligase [Bacteroidota bacterium]
MHQETIHITLPDGSVKSLPKGITGLELAQGISEGLARQVVAISVNGEVWDATQPLHQDATVQLLTWNDEGGKSTFWHSSAHLLAEALEALYPGIQLGIGPAIERGFYYDVDFGQYDFDASHLEKIEAKMLALAQQKNVYKRIEISKSEAVQHFQEKGDVYKLELLEGLEDGQITFYEQGAFTDLCKGPHIPHTGFIKAIKLLNIAGAYWRGNEKNKQLTRIYGITFPQAKELKAYLTLLEEAKKRNHQKLGKELGLFTFSEKVGIGLPLWLPKGAMLRERLEQFLREAQLKAGYQPVVTPHIGHKNLYVTSGHYEKYGQDSFQPIHTPHEGEEFLLKPMNCPHHCELYKSEPRSYKDLPVRLAEFGTVYRYEQHGELHGLARTRGFTQDDAHIFCRPDQVKAEFAKVIDLVLYVFRALDLQTYTAQISLRDPAKAEKYIGSEEAWAQAEQAIQEVVAEKGLKAIKELGEAAFYGPKLDFMVKDALGRSWQLGTVQLDYQLPERFELEYIGADNKKHRPVMIHRAPFGSLERFIALLIEHTGGKFPFWLTPDQVAVLPISEKYADYAERVCQALAVEGIRGFVDHRDEKIGKKIRDTELRKIPYMLIVGEKEMLDNTVAVRKQGAGDQGSQSVEEFTIMIANLLSDEMPSSPAGEHVADPG